MGSRSYALSDGRTIEATVELGQWSASLTADARSHIIGFPLEAVLMEVIGLNPAHDEIPGDIVRLAEHVRADIPPEDWPTGPLTA